MRLHENRTLFRQSIEFAALKNEAVLEALKMIQERLKAISWTIKIETKE